MKLYNRDRARRSLFDTISYRALSQIATVLSYAVLVRSVTEQAFGVLMLMYAVIPILNTFGSLGLDHIIRRFQPEYLSAGRVAVSAWLVRLMCRLRFLSNVTLLLFILLAWNWVAPWFGLAAYRLNFLMFGVLILFHFQVNLLQFSLSSHMLHKYSVGSIALMSTAKLAGYSFFAVFHELTLQSAILCDLFGYVIAYALLVYAKRQVYLAEGVKRVEVPDGEERVRIRRYGFYSHWNDAASILQYSETDRFFVARLMNPIAVGAYAFYTRLAEMATSFVPQRLFDNLVQPLFFGVPAHEAPEKIPRYFTFLINMSLVYQLPLITFTLVYHQDLVQLVFGGKFIEHSFLLPIVIAFTTTDNVFSTPIHLVAQYNEKASTILKSQILGFYQVAAMLALVPLMGLVGAAIASGTFHVTRNIFVWWRVRDQGIWTNWRAVLLSTVMVWGSVALICSQLRAATELPSFVEMLMGGILCAVAALTYLRTPAICTSDRAILGNVLHGREGKFLQLIGLLPARQLD